MRFSGINDCGQLGNHTLKIRILGNRVFPDLIGVRSEIDIVIGRIIEQSCLFVVETNNCLGFVIIFKKYLVGADDFGVLKKTRSYAGTQSDQSFDAFGGEEGVTQNLLDRFCQPVRRVVRGE